MIGADCEPNVTGDAGYENVIQADLERGLDPLSRMAGDRFDRILLLDRLEHLREPGNLLEDCRRLLAARGKLIVSVPNAVNFTMRLMVLFGAFRYADRGIMDWSHLRFFTRKTIRALLEEYGYRITATHFTVVPLERLVSLRPTNSLFRLANGALRAATAILPGLFAYEIVLVGGAISVPPLFSISDATESESSGSIVAWGH